MKIGEKIIYNGIEAILIGQKFISCANCVFFRSDCPIDDEEELKCVDGKSHLFGVFEKVKNNANS